MFPLDDFLSALDKKITEELTSAQTSEQLWRISGKARAIADFRNEVKARSTQIRNQRGGIPPKRFD